MAVQFSVYHGLDVQPHLTDLARLRIHVFREWPYLYAGDAAYEADYLQVYLRSSRSIVILAHDQDRLVGASTGLPLAEESEDFHGPFLQSQRCANEVFYFGESVLLPNYRGLGIGHRFFDLREQHATSLSFTTVRFAAVRRSASDNRRPAFVRDLQPFWRARGYAPNGLSMQLAWRELDQLEDTVNTLDFWERQLP